MGMAENDFGRPTKFGENRTSSYLQEDTAELWGDTGNLARNRDRQIVFVLVAAG
jgi:hypothetical protein